MKGYHVYSKIQQFRTAGFSQRQVARILEWLREFPDLTAAQVCDWLREHYREDVSERTVSRYVKQLREEYGLKKSAAPRE